jgi:hypothetical protein
LPEGHDRGVVDGFDWLRLASVGASALQTHDGLQALHDHGRAELFRDSPSKNPLNLADARIDDRTAKAVIDHPSLKNLEAEWAEIADWQAGVQLADRPQRVFHVLDLPSGLAVLDVVAFRELPIERQDLFDGQIPDGAMGADVLRGPIGLRLALGAPVRDLTFITFVALVAAVSAKILILAIDSNDGFARRFVKAVRWNFSLFSRHVRLSF